MNAELKMTDTEKHFTRLFKENQAEIFSGSSDYVNSLRSKALENFQQTGLPGKKDEKYKYSPVIEYFSKELNQSFSHEEIELKISDLFECGIPELDTYVIIVLNGSYYHPDNELTTLKNGVVFGSLRAAAKKFPDLFKKHYAKYASCVNDGVTALNTAFALDGAFLHIPKNIACDKPFQIIHLLFSDQSQMVYPRNLFILEENAEAKVLICDHTLSDHEYLTNSVTEIYAGPNSNLDLTRIQNEHNQAAQLTNSYVHQMKNSSLSSNCITLHGGKVRNNLYVNLAGPGADNRSLGLFMADGSQHVDSYTYVNHLVPDCTSNQLYKGILDENATGVFNGKIHVWKDAQRTQAYQKNNNLLLSDTAKMNTRPQLEIYADDVKCSHGATVGQLDPDALFYLRSRGIPYKESLHLLTYAFAHAVLSEIKLESLRESVTDLVEKRLRGELLPCNNCKMTCR